MKLKQTLRGKIGSGRILVVVIIVFGAGRLPELGTALGEGIKNFKKGYRESKTLDVTPPETNAPDTNTGKTKE